MKCPTCQQEHPDDARFCTTCGWALRSPALLASGTPDPLPAPVPPPAAVPRPGSRDPAGDLYSRVLEFLAKSTAEPTGLQAAAVVLGVCLVVTLVGWAPLSWPPNLVNQFVAALSPRSCGPVAQGLLFGSCSAVLAVYAHVGSLAVMALLYVFRKGLTKGVSRLLGLLPSQAAFLSGPVLATVLFTMGWAGVAFHFFSRPGIVRDGLFPPVVGLLTYAIARYDPDVQHLLNPLWATRDRWSVKVRLGATFAVSAVTSLYLTDRVAAPVRDQAVVILSMIAGYLLMAPRHTDLASGLRQALGVNEGGGQ